MSVNAKIMKSIEEGRREDHKKTLEGITVPRRGTLALNDNKTEYTFHFQGIAVNLKQDHEGIHVTACDKTEQHVLGKICLPSCVLHALSE
jgi:hypothetical protein